MVATRAADTPDVSLRIGIDLVDVASIEAALAQHRDRYLERVYTDTELEECRMGDTVDPRRLAGRFAAKEAVMKVLDPSPRDAVPWRSIGVQRASSGRPEVRLTGAARALAAERRISGLALSLTHEGAHAAAFVVGQAAEAR